MCHMAVAALALSCFLSYSSDGNCQYFCDQILLYYVFLLSFFAYEYVNRFTGSTIGRELIDLVFSLCQ